MGQRTIRGEQDQSLAIHIKSSGRIDTGNSHIIGQRRASPWVGKAGQDPIGFVEGNGVSSEA